MSDSNDGQWHDWNFSGLKPYRRELRHCIGVEGIISVAWENLAGPADHVVIHKSHFGFAFCIRAAA